MNISRSDLYRIILEEYAKEEGITLSENKADDLLKWLRGGEKPDWVDDEREIPDPPEVPDAPPAAADTMPFPADDMPQYDDESIDDGGAYDPEAEAAESPLDQGSLEDQLMDLIQGLPPEEVADLFQAVFEKIPGVELGSGEDSEGPPPTEYGGEELELRQKQGRRIGYEEGLQFENLMELVREVIEEGHYHDVDPAYDVMKGEQPPGPDDEFDLGGMTDVELVNQAWKDGIEEMIVLDGEGDLANREELLAAMNDV